MSILEKMLIRHEGLRLKAYSDSVGVPTVGVGHNLNKPIRREAAILILKNDIEDAYNDLNNSFRWFAGLDDVRKDALTDMCFNLGISRFKEFHNMIIALSNKDWEVAAEEALDSKWAKQVGGRAVELANMIKTGEYQQ